MKALVRYIGIEGMESSPAWEASQILAKGGTIIYPADTLYGIGADATNCEAIKKIDMLKGRKGSPQIVLILREWLPKYVRDCEKLSPLLDCFSPGPLTIIAKYSGHGICPKICPQGKIAFRITSSWFAELILEIFGKPITSTSVNISGQQPLADPDEILEKFGDKVDGIFLFKNLSLEGPPSTIIDATEFPQKFEIIREGAISQKAILNAIGLDCLC